MPTVANVAVQPECSHSYTFAVCDRTASRMSDCCVQCRRRPDLGTSTQQTNLPRRSITNYQHSRPRPGKYQYLPPGVVRQAQHKLNHLAVALYTRSGFFLLRVAKRIPLTAYGGAVLGSSTARLLCRLLRSAGTESHHPIYCQPYDHRLDELKAKL